MPEPFIKQDIEVLSVVIPAGTAVSEGLQTEGRPMAAIMMPDAWTAANLSFQWNHPWFGSLDVYDEDGSEKVVTAAAGRFILLNPADWS